MAVPPGGGGYSQKNWVGVCGPLPKTLTLFMTKICDFPYPIYDLTKNLIPYFVKGFCCLYFLAYKAAGGEEGKARMEGGGHDKEVASSKKSAFKTTVQKLLPYI